MADGDTCVGGRQSELEAELAEVVGASHEARWIVDEAHGDAPAARAMAERRAAGEPLQYIFGHWPFRTLDLAVDPRVLIPRPETEQVVEVALGEARRLARADARADGLIVVDAGTGTGAIALSLAVELGPDVVRQVWATDASAGALAVAAANVESVHTAGRFATGSAALPEVALVEGSWLGPLPESLRGHVDLVVSNPPYVSAAEWEELDDEVRCEPRSALVAGPGGDGTPGLADVEAVLAGASAWAARPATVVVELAPHQADAAAALARRLGYDDVRVEPDLTGRARALVARVASAGSRPGDIGYT